MGDVLFIVWRESVEAMLVVGILFVWLRQQDDARQGLRWLWTGVGLGLAAAAGLGMAILGAASFLDGESGEWFQAGMVLVAVLLIVQMVWWMRRHGRTLKRELEQGAARHLEERNGWGIAVLVAIAIAREGSETVIFLYGLGARHSGADLALFAGSAALGLALAFATFWLLQASSRWLSWRTFFRFSETLLLLLAAALLMSGVDRLISLDVLPTLVDPLWNTTALLDDGGSVGGLVSALTGYRAQPALISVLIYAAFWLGVWWLLRHSAVPTQAREQALPARS